MAPKAAGTNGGANTDSQVEKEVCQLSSKRKVKLSSYQGRAMVHIREYYQADDGSEQPTKKGIALTKEQWSKLKVRLIKLSVLKN